MLRNIVINFAQLTRPSLLSCFKYIWLWFCLLSTRPHPLHPYHFSSSSYSDNFFHYHFIFFPFWQPLIFSYGHYYDHGRLVTIAVTAKEVPFDYCRLSYAFV